MALIVEDGSIVAGAESYCSVAFADQFHSDRGNFGWSGETADKEAALRRATDYMTQMYRPRWLGSRVQYTQSLDWPRVGVVLSDINVFVGDGGFYGNLQANVVPLQVMQACALLALKAIAIDDSGNAIELAPDVQRVTKREKVGTLEVEYADGALPYVRFRAIDHLLDIFLAGGLSGVRLVRA